MLRLMAHAHPGTFACRVITPGSRNPALRDAVRALGVPYREVGAADVFGWRRLLRDDPPDVLYLFGRFRTVAWAAIARSAGVRCIVAAERSAANRRSDRWARRLDRRLVTAYVANSENAARNLRSIVGEDGPPVHVVVNGIEDGHLSFRDPDADGAPRLLCVGNITPNKGHVVLLEAVRILRARYPTLRATLVGRDFTEGRLFREAEAKGLGDTYDARGFADDVRPFLARSTVAVLPSLRREGMPTALLEAMAAGVPVVASRVGGVSEIVDDGKTGLLVPPGDPHALARTIGLLLDDPDLRRSLARSARRYVLARHGIAHMVAGHRSAFASTLARAEKRSASGAPIPAVVAHVTTAATSLRYLLLNQLTTLQDAGYTVVGVSAPGPDASLVEASGIRHEPVPMTRRVTPLADGLSLFRLYRLMRRRRFTLVHAHTPKPGLLAQVAARLAGVPVVVNTIHGFYFHDRMPGGRRRFWVAIERIAARCSDLILSQNEEDVETAVREGIAPRHLLRVLGNGIDLARFDPARVGTDARRRTRLSLGLPADAPLVGFVGRLVAEKGVPELLEAAVLVRERFPEARFLFVGSLDAEKADGVTPDVAHARGLGAACVFTGVRQDMPELYTAMDVFVLPSHREGFPRAPMEASAMRVPCVVTDVRGCRQAVSAGRNGLLVPVGDVRALADAIVSVLADPDLARRLGEEGRRRALAEFDERRVAAKVLSEYERLLEEKGLGARIPSARAEAGARAYRRAVSE
jgi:glycosyltransferase involved in cell wall biosynthesis